MKYAAMPQFQSVLADVLRCRQMWYTHKVAINIKGYVSCGGTLYVFSFDSFTDFGT